MFSGNIYDLLKNLLRIKCSCRIIRIDDNNSFCLVCDFLFDILNIRIPFRLFVTDIMNSSTSCQSSAGSPQRIVRRWNENFISGVKQSGHAEIDQLTDAVSSVNVIDGNIGDVF